MNRSLATLLLAAALTTGCAVRKIPNTDIDDTPETRAIIKVVNTYRQAFERRNVSGILALTDDSFADNAGTATPDDDLDKAKLAQLLPARFERIEDVRLDINVRRIEFEDTGEARVTYTYALSFKMPQYSTRTQSETDIKQMVLRRDGGNEPQWRILSGL